MNNVSQAERRRFPRFNVPIPLVLFISRVEDAGNTTIRATSINISLNGVYCMIDQFIPMFDKIEITFVLPENPEAPPRFMSQYEGIVVRIEPEAQEAGRHEYQVAIYFQNLTQEQQDFLYTLILSYLQRFAAHA